MRTKTYGVKNIFDTQLSCMLFSFGEAASRLCGKGIAPTNSIYHPSPDPQITTCLKTCLSLQVLLKKENGSKANQSYLYYSRCARFRSRFDK